MGIAVIDDQVKSVVLTPHVDHEREGVPNPDRTSDPGPRSSKSISDLHVALGRSESENDGIPSSNSADS